MSEHRVLFIVNSLIFLQSMLPAIQEEKKNQIPCDVLVPPIPEYDPYFFKARDGLIKYIKNIGIEPLTEFPAGKTYDAVYSAYPNFYNEITSLNKVKYNVRYSYGPHGSKPYLFTQSTYNFYDFILRFSEVDVSIFSAFAKSYSVGNIKLANYKRNRINKGEKKTILYLPTHNAEGISGNSVNSDTILMLTNLQNKYNVITKMHSHTHYIENQKEQRELLNSFDKTFDENAFMVDMLNQADVVLSDISSAIFDAIAGDVPVALVGYGEQIYYGGKLCYLNQLINDGIIPGTNDINQLEDIIEQALTPECFAKQQKLKKEMFAYEGKECLDAFMKFQNELFEDRVDSWYIASRKAIREKHIKDEEDLQKLRTIAMPPFGTVFFDTGKGFSEDEKSVTEINREDCFFHFSCDISENLKSIRFDPVEWYCCTVCNLQIIADFDVLPYTVLNGVTLEDGVILFDNIDPQILVDIPKGKSKLNISGTVIPLGEKEFSFYAKRIIALTEQKNELQELSEQKSEELQELYAEFETANEELAHYKEHYQAAISQRDSLTYELANVRAEKEAQFMAFYKSTSWRITKPFRVVVRTVRRIFSVPKRAFILSGKFLRNVKTYGIKDSARKTREYLNQRNTTNEIVKKLNIESYNNSHKNYKAYDSEYQENKDFSEYTTDIKALAFYLPQFHTIPENDEWWGEGFTEWTNTQSATPMFEGHYQPRIPHKDIGYYDLSDVKTLEKQVSLAKQHGIFGFCFYYYWFSGKRLLEKPIDLLLANPHIDINFCLCWANENWTRTWDGQDKEVLMAQNYSEEDKFNFIDDLMPYISDKRYIRVNGKPVIVVYNPGKIPNCKYVFKAWRKRARELKIGKILIWVCESLESTVYDLDIAREVDGTVEFPPRNMEISGAHINDIDTDGREAYFWNYEICVKRLLDKNESLVENGSVLPPRYLTSMMGWDNAARRKEGFNTFYAYSLKCFYDWCCRNVKYARNKLNEEERFVFVNAWNEWAEGTYLEPDEKFGYANINTLSKAIFDIEFNDHLRVIRKSTTVNYKDVNFNAKIAVHVHLFYLDIADEVIENINKIPYEYDCFISTDTNNKAKVITKKFKNLCNAKNVYVEVFDNKGRDIAPFIFQMKGNIKNYEYICHIHTKKSKHGNFGNDWRKYLYNNLFGETYNIREIFNLFENDEYLGILFPETYPPILSACIWSVNLSPSKELLSKNNIVIDLPEENPVFPAGSMFWARTDAIADIFEFDISKNDFSDEDGQVDGTLAHCIERLWVYLAKHRGYTYMQTLRE